MSQKVPACVLREEAPGEKERSTRCGIIKCRLDGRLGSFDPFFPEHNNAAELMIAIPGTLAYASGRRYYRKKRVKDKERR